MNSRLKISYQHWRDRDSATLWHPFADIAESISIPIIDRADGIYLYELDGNRLIDGISSWWCCNLGHNHPSLVEAIVSQAHNLQHTMLGNLSHTQAIRLADKLASIAPNGLCRSFFASDGACAVEAALKMAIQYWHMQGKSEKKQFISLQNGYHGDTLGAMGVGFMPSFHAPFSGAVIPSIQAPAPLCPTCPYKNDCSGQCFSSMKKCIKKNHEKAAAVIIEPLCQGAAGMNIYKPIYLKLLREACDEYNVLLIADEIAVAFGRCGSWFACDQADILCLGKGITGGYLPLSVTMVTEKIYQAFHSSSFLHGHTFCGNPIASALACAAIDIYENMLPTIPYKVLHDAFSKLKPFLSNIRTLGMIAAGDTPSYEIAKRIALDCQTHGLLIRPLGKVIYLCPPLTSTPEEIKRMVSILYTACKKTTSWIPPK